METLKVEIKKDLFSDSQGLSVTFPPIGKTGKATVFTCNLMANDNPGFRCVEYEKQHVKTLVHDFLKSKESRFIALQSKPTNSNLTVLMNEIAALRHTVRLWAQNEFYSYLRGFILPKIDLLRTHNPQNKFFQYENDLMNYLMAVCENRVKKGSL